MFVRVGAFVLACALALTVGKAAAQDRAPIDEEAGTTGNADGAAEPSGARTERETPASDPGGATATSQGPGARTSAGPPGDPAGAQTAEPSGGASQSATPQESKKKKESKGIRFELNEEGDRYIRLISWHQIWTRYLQTNPGTQVQGQSDDHYFDIGIRRARLLLFGQFTDDLLILTHVGINNQTFNNLRKPQVFVHDAWVQHRIFRDYLHLGFGIHYWNGISRMSSASTLNFLGIDTPMFAWPVFAQSDQFARQMGIYAKGTIDIFNYRLAVNRPFEAGPKRSEVSSISYNRQANTWAFTGYFHLELWEKESHKLPYFVGTYLGKKKVFNVGTGFYWQQDAMVSPDGGGGFDTHDHLLFAGDVFLDLPLGDNADKGALTAYGGFWHYDLGPDHIRMVGIMNPGTGGTTLNGPGHAYPMFASGENIYGQLGYLLPFEFLGGHQLQPYTAVHAGLLEALDEPSVVFDVGLNYYVTGHRAKFTLNYKNRPIFVNNAAGEAVVDDRRGELVLQAQLFF